MRKKPLPKWSEAKTRLEVIYLFLRIVALIGAGIATMQGVIHLAG